MATFFLALVFILTIALPLLAWFGTTRMVAGQPPYARLRRDARGFPMDQVDAWLTDHTDLGPRQRQSVRQAVLGGRPVPQEPLRPAARALATAMLAGEVQPPTIGRHYWTVPASGGLMLAAGVALVLAIRPVPSSGAICAVDGGVILVASLLWPPRLRRRLEQAAGPAGERG